MAAKLTADAAAAIVDVARAAGDAGHGQEQGQAGGDGRAEGDEQQDLDPGPRRHVEVGHVVDQGAGGLGQVGVLLGGEPHRDQHGAPVGGHEAGLGGLGQGVDDGGGAGGAVQVGDHRLHAGGVPGDRCVLVVHDDRGLGAELREVPAELVAHLLGGRALGLPPGARQRARRGHGEGSGE